MFTNEKEIQTINKKSLFSLNLKNFHLFLSNLNIDRFQFLRQKFSAIPIYYLISKEKSVIENQLKKKNVYDSCENYFGEIYKEFLKDSLEDIILDTDESEVLFLNLNLLGTKVSAVHYNPQQFFLNDSDWKSEFLSLFFEYLIQSNAIDLKSILLFAKTFRIKMPLVKTRICL